MHTLRTDRLRTCGFPPRRGDFRSGAMARIARRRAAPTVVPTCDHNDGAFPGGDTTGTSDMVKVSEVEYDGGADKGPGLVTKRIAYVADSTTGKRETSLLHDGRGRTPAANPHESPKAPESQQDRPPDQPTGEKRGGRDSNPQPPA